MKRLISLTMVTAFLIAVSVSYLFMPRLMAQRPPAEVEICHRALGPPDSPDDGFLVTVPESAVPGHEAHGDCTLFYVAADLIHCTCQEPSLFLE